MPGTTMIPAPGHIQLGRGVRRLRQARHLSIEDLAHAAGLHSTYLSTVERGLSNPTWSKVCGLAEAFGITICALARVAEAEAYGAPYVPMSPGAEVA
jgi:transcriptional regulator with XRE-family HTH domain